MAAQFSLDGVKGEMYVDSNHAKFLAHTLNDLRKSKKMCDLILISPPKEFFAHRNVVCAASPYILERLTVTSPAEKESFDSNSTSLGSRIEIKTISADVFEDILNFIYIGEVCVSEENVRKLIAASEILRMQKLKELTCRFYEKRLCPANCLSIAALANEFNCDSLRKAADKFILDHFLEVSKFHEFQGLDIEHLISILQSDEINANREEQIFTAAMEWMHYDLPNRKVYINKLLSCIRLLLLSKYFVIDVLEKDEILMANPDCKDLIQNCKNVLTLPDRKHMFCHNNLGKPRDFSDICEVILACGGNQERMSSNEVLCYVPSQDFWYPLAPLMKSRYKSSSAVLNNEVYCIGGMFEGISPIKNIERYSFAMDRWIDSSPFPDPISGHVSCVFNGEIYVIGGSEDDTISNNVWKYSIKRGVWMEVKNLLIPRRDATVAVHNQLYVIGGYGPDGQSLASVERFDPYQNQWAKIFPMNSPRAFASACCIGDRIFVFGGEYAGWSYYRTAEVFDIKTDEWNSISDFSVPRAHMGIAAYHGKIYLVGGMVSAESVVDQYGVDEEEFVDVNETKVVECYDTVKGVWSKACSLPMATAGANCAVISTSNIVLSQRCGF
ncbi:kelch-like protein 3 [Clytia hemisphaerica]|uniref:kelch-like protein 3 n=1 Tax=Clytia hemisphaerica TaxID=252671 RepID=UPI0034D6B0CD|eukprot:TCONS_00069982-protein